jgi:hypothetical protein
MDMAEKHAQGELDLKHALFHSLLPEDGLVFVLAKGSKRKFLTNPKEDAQRLYFREWYRIKT